MLPYKSLLKTEKNSDTPVYVQIANQVAREITNGVIKPNTRLPGTRVMGELLSIHRNTVVAAYEELALQGWIQLVPKKGAFVSTRIPEIKPRPVPDKKKVAAVASQTAFPLYSRIHLEVPRLFSKKMLEFNDGLPDERMAPLAELNRAYRSQFKRTFKRTSPGYTAIAGHPDLRKEISIYLNETRGLKTTSENIFITKGSQMGIFLASQLLVQPGQRVAVGETNYHAADAAFEYTGAILERIPLDERGLDVSYLEHLCKRKKIAAVYITPHHHFPTTITLSACRRMELIALAEQYNFAVLEDDYDYDFHYKSSPILPLASTDYDGRVVYIGSLSKSVSPGLRVAYLVAPVNMIRELEKLRFLIDRQGDPILEQAIAQLFSEGVMKRHLKKALAAYHQRRDVFCTMLGKLGGNVSFRVPDGGLAVWVAFNERLPLQTVAQRAFKNGLIINDGSCYKTGSTPALNATRMGFASLTIAELERAMAILKSIV